MAEPFLAEIRMMSFNFAPKGWAFADGQLLTINQNQGLFSLLGTTFGGDGRVNFALPDLRSRTPIHVSNSHILGDRGGEQNHTVSINELPTHTHTMKASDAGPATSNPVGNSLSSSKPANQYTRQQINPVTLAPATIANVGGSQAHSNMQPFLTVSFCIALQGNFPSPN
ncbi:phage tail protein [Dyadobacter subterraneus]|uniref:Phage tail protein n=1 Tax=Dyadobacter subterraneus TaxID=2773304 RepID=A0ABR9W8J3_9BACT|nr:tail fiber protein [Dyadobacter subterraneus]MBE9461798.1 phage tail protein [Dyadobacter subterraneus]